MRVFTECTASSIDRPDTSSVCSPIENSAAAPVVDRDDRGDDRTRPQVAQHVRRPDDHVVIDPRRRLRSAGVARREHHDRRHSLQVEHLENREVAICENECREEDVVRSERSVCRDMHEIGAFEQASCGIAGRRRHDRVGTPPQPGRSPPARAHRRRGRGHRGSRGGERRPRRHPMTSRRSWARSSGAATRATATRSSTDGGSERPD